MGLPGAGGFHPLLPFWEARPPLVAVFLAGGRLSARLGSWEVVDGSEWFRMLTARVLPVEHPPAC